MIIYTVKEGDSAFSISQRFGVPYDLLIENNGIESITSALPVGLSLVIAIPETVHTVQSGETLEGIAAEYAVSVNSLYRNNLNLRGTDEIYEGEELVIRYEDGEVFDFVTGGYAYTFINDELLDTTLPAISLIMPFTYGFRTDGTLITPNDARILERARVYGRSPYLHLSTLDENGNFSNSLSNILLSEEQAWEILLQNVISEMESKGYVGADIDFEFLLRDDKENYVRFIAYMREGLNEKGYPLIVAVPPKTSSEQTGLLYEGVDYRALGEAANFVLLMTYEWGYTYGPPMPVSPTPSVRRVLEYAIGEIPREKIYMGISNYGYDWPLPYEKGKSVARSISTVEAFELASRYGSSIMYDEQYEAPYFYYTTDGIDHEVWFEDARSILAKFRLINDFGFHGGLYWNFNRENPQNLTLLANSLNYEN